MDTYQLVPSNIIVCSCIALYKNTSNVHVKFVVSYRVGFDGPFFFFVKYEFLCDFTWAPVSRAPLGTPAKDPPSRPLPQRRQKRHVAFCDRAATGAPVVFCDTKKGVAACRFLRQVGRHCWRRVWRRDVARGFCTRRTTSCEFEWRSLP